MGSGGDGNDSRRRRRGAGTPGSRTEATRRSDREGARALLATGHRLRRSGHSEAQRALSNGIIQVALEEKLEEEGFALDHPDSGTPLQSPLAQACAAAASGFGVESMGTSAISTGFRFRKTGASFAAASSKLHSKSCRPT